MNKSHLKHKKEFHLGKIQFYSNKEMEYRAFIGFIALIITLDKRRITEDKNLYSSYSLSNTANWREC